MTFEEFEKDCVAYNLQEQDGPVRFTLFEVEYYDVAGRKFYAVPGSACLMQWHYTKGGDVISRPKMELPADYYSCRKPSKLPFRDEEIVKIYDLYVSNTV